LSYLTVTRLIDPATGATYSVRASIERELACAEAV
jgi:hypothetical protein